jgi:hypothetical protein
MNSTINTVIIDHIKNSELEENLKSFLIKALDLEYDKQEREVFRYANEYRKLVDEYFEG